MALINDILNAAHNIHLNGSFYIVSNIYSNQIQSYSRKHIQIYWFDSTMDILFVSFCFPMIYTIKRTNILQKRQLRWRNEKKQKKKQKKIFSIKESLRNERRLKPCFISISQFMLPSMWATAWKKLNKLALPYRRSD